MHEQEKGRGIELARLSRAERDQLVSQLMFGRHWQGAREAMMMLSHAWGLGTPGGGEAEGAADHE